MELPDYPFESHFVDIEGRRIHYVDEGKGETILMLHGNPTWSYLYRHFILALRGKYRCVAIDHLGFGFSEKPADADYSMKAHIRRLGEFVDALNLENITLVVQDWGGIIGLGWAHANKEKISRLFIMNTTGFPVDFGGVREMGKDTPWGIGLLWLLKIPLLGELFVQGMNGFVKYFVPMGIHNKERLTPEVMAGYEAPYPTWGSRRTHLLSPRQIPALPRNNHPIMNLLKETELGLAGWTVPTQIAWGLRDPVFTEWFIGKFEALLPNHRPTLKLKNASHFLQDDEPEPLIESLDAFMQATAVKKAAKKTAAKKPAEKKAAPKKKAAAKAAKGKTAAKKPAAKKKAAAKVKTTKAAKKPAAAIKATASKKTVTAAKKNAASKKTAKKKAEKVDLATV